MSLSYYRSVLSEAIFEAMKRQHRFLRLGLKTFQAAVILFLFVSENAQAQNVPDYVLVNGKIFTAEPKHTYVQAVAIKGERILSVGTSEEIWRLASSHTIRIDLHGRLVIPGINDAHYHFLPRPFAHQLLLRGQEPTWNEVKNEIAAAVATTPPGTLINGVIGLAMFDEPEANRATLDKLSPNHPVQLACFWGHCSIFNSLFMRKVGIDATNPTRLAAFTLATLKEESSYGPSSTPIFVFTRSFRNPRPRKCKCRMQSRC